MSRTVFALVLQCRSSSVVAALRQGVYSEGGAAPPPL